MTAYLKEIEIDELLTSVAYDSMNPTQDLWDHLEAEDPTDLLVQSGFDYLVNHSITGFGAEGRLDVQRINRDGYPFLGNGVAFTMYLPDGEGPVSGRVNVRLYGVFLPVVDL